MCNRTYAGLFVLIALVLAIFALFASQSMLVHVIYVTRFFDVMIPVLAVGALIKYLWCCKK